MKENTILFNNYNKPIKAKQYQNYNYYIKDDYVKECKKG